MALTASVSTWPSQPLSAEEKTQGLVPASDTQALAAALAA